MDDHHQRPNADVIGTVGEAQQEDGCSMMDDLLLEILMRKGRWRIKDEPAFCPGSSLSPAEQ